MEGYWCKEWEQGRRFLVKIDPGRAVVERLQAFARQHNLYSGLVLSAVGSVQNARFRGIKTGARLPITPPRMHVHEEEGPLELVGLNGNFFLDEQGDIDIHLHIMVGKSSGEVLGGHLFDATVFATCELVVVEVLAEGIERHQSRRGGIPTLYIEEDN